MTKKEIRKFIKKIFLETEIRDLTADSRAIAVRVIDHPEWQKAVSILLYAHLPDEVETSQLIETALQQKKAVYLPGISGQAIDFYRVRTAGDYSEKNTFGIHEPDQHLPRFIMEDTINYPCCIIVPGRAFDKAHNRVGRGAGYYDRFFTGLKNSPAGHPFLMGICFSFQVVAAIPSASHDIPVHTVITESDIY
ncbi:MAG: 5-formyltetrahydrofolate cyclo-ligase [Spirochaetales bacterium]|nr:5-formyltetrahydrofolate cyclo-ligase [Spirochaetales bacterium]